MHCVAAQSNEFRIRAQTSASPPHAVVVDAVTDSVLLALDPESALEESTQRDAQQADAAQEEAADAEQDPRSLQGAVEALAKFTSETVVGKRCEYVLNADHCLPSMRGNSERLSCGLDLPSC